MDSPPPVRWDLIDLDDTRRRARAARRKQGLPAKIREPELLALVVRELRLVRGRRRSEL
jgi:hypothetical protein